jgi:hypothetical protein
MAERRDLTIYPGLTFGPEKFTLPEDASMMTVVVRAEFRREPGAPLLLGFTPPFILESARLKAQIQLDSEQTKLFEPGHCEWGMILTYNDGRRIQVAWGTVCVILTVPDAVGMDPPAS